MDTTEIKNIAIKTLPLRATANGKTDVIANTASPAFGHATLR